MKNYKVTNRGKILLILYFVGIIGSYFLEPLVFYFLISLLVILLGIECTTYLLENTKNSKGNAKEEADEMEVELQNINQNNIIPDNNHEKTVEQETTMLEVSDKKQSTEALDMNKEAYESLVDDFESIDEDIQSMEKDLEVIGKKAINIQKDSIVSYYEQKKVTINNSLVNENEQSLDDLPQNYEEESLLDSIVERLKEIFSFKRYRIGNLVLHNHFGIGKIIDVEESLKASFINDQIEEIIEFEYDKNNKIPELNLFKVPKEEDERQYYYNYKRDVSNELLSIIDKIHLNLPDIKYQWNVFLKSGSTFEKYDFIAISDQVHLFTQEPKGEMRTQLLEELIEDFELEIKIHEISKYTAINSILLKSKIKGIMPLEIMKDVNKLIEENNIKDFNERMQYSSPINKE